MHKFIHIILNHFHIKTAFKAVFLRTNQVFSQNRPIIHQLIHIIHSFQKKTGVIFANVIIS